MARCRCDPANQQVCACAFQDSDDIALTGNATPANPLIPSTTLDPDSANLLSSSPAGLLGLLPDELNEAPSFRIYRGGTQTIDNSVYTAITFTDAVWDTDQMWDASTPNLVTVNTPGIYFCIGQIRWAANATGIRQVFMEVNGIQNFGETVLQANTASGIVTQFDSAGFWKFEGGDAIVLRVFHNIDGGGTLNVVQASFTSPHFMGVRVAPLP